jgi:hypothetical protein
MCFTLNDRAGPRGVAGEAWRVSRRPISNRPLAGGRFPIAFENLLGRYRLPLPADPSQGLADLLDVGRRPQANDPDPHAGREVKEVNRVPNAAHSDAQLAGDAGNREKIFVDGRH